MEGLCWDRQQFLLPKVFGASVSSFGGVSGSKVRAQEVTWHPRHPPSMVFDLLCDGLGLPSSCCSAVLLQVWRRCGLLAGFGSF